MDLNPQVEERTRQARAAIDARVSAAMGDVAAAEDAMARQCLALAAPDRVYLVRWVDRGWLAMPPAGPPFTDPFVLVNPQPRGLVSLLPDGHPAIDG